MEVLSRTQLLTRLGSRDALDRALGVSWQRVLHGAYVPVEVTIDLAVRARAAARLLPDHAHLSDRCLLWLHGVDVLPPGSPVLEGVVPRGTVVPRRAGMRLREAHLPLEDRTEYAGLRVLRPARAVADLLRMLPLVEAVVVADAVLHAGLCTSDELHLELSRHARLRGVRGAYRALELSDPAAESPPESRVRLILVSAGLQPVPQYDVRDAAGSWLARVDLAFPALRVAVEYDGRAVHERADVFTRDRQRQNALVRAGWVVLRFTAADLHAPSALVQTVLAALQRVAA